MSEFERRAKFVPGYNYLHETGPQRRGQHGMEIAFALIGPLGAIAFEMNTMWTPPGIVDAGSREVVHVDYEQTDRWGTTGLVRPPSGIAVFVHWRKAFDAFLSEPRDGCGWLDGDPCWGDATYTGSDPILRRFIKEGEDAVWSALDEWYQEIAARELAVSTDA